MIQIKPYISTKYACSCGGDFYFSELIWQGLHVCEKLVCYKCYRTRITSLPVNQAGIEQYSFFPESGIILDASEKPVKENWFSSKLKSISNPVSAPVEIEIEVFKKYDDVLILNTIDYIYGHSLLFLLNLQRIIKSKNRPGIIVLVQPMIKWLIPKQHIAEIWTVKLGFQKMNYFHSDLSEKINAELGRFSTVWLSKGHLIPTNENIEIENFTGIKPFDFKKRPDRPRITFVWREDPDRLWIRNIYLLKGFKKLGFRKILLPIHIIRVILFFMLLKKKFGNGFKYTVAGLGTTGKLPHFIDDQRVKSFDTGNEKYLCGIYAESVLVIGVHGSALLLPSAHAGMAVSLMPSKRWGNYAEDILFTEDDLRLACFQRRILPLNLSVFEIRDIVVDMISGRESFIRKFIHPDEL